MGDGEGKKAEGRQGPSLGSGGQEQGTRPQQPRLTMVPGNTTLSSQEKRRDMWSEQKAKARTWVLAKVCWDARGGGGGG